MNSKLARLATPLLCTSLALAAPASARQVVNLLDDDVTLDWQVQRSSSIHAVDTHVATATSGGKLFTLTQMGANLTLASHDGSNGATLWSTTNLGNLNSFAPDLMTISADGTSLFLAGSASGKAAVAKLDANTGASIWAVTLPTSTLYNTDVKDIDVAPHGTGLAVVATGAGFLTQQVYTMYVDGNTGAVAWLDTLDDLTQFAEDARLVALDAAGGRVHSASMTQDAGFTSRAFMRTFDVTTGALVWSDLYPATGTSSAAPVALELDPLGGRLFVLVSGAVNELRTYAAATGSNAWSATTQPMRTHIALQPGGAQVAAAGAGVNPPIVEAFDAATGAALWLGVVSTGQQPSNIKVVGLAYLPNGSRLVLGLDGNYQTMGSPPTQSFLAAALDATTGSATWSTAEPPTLTSGGSVAGFALVDATAGPRAVVATELTSVSNADVRLVALETDFGTQSWEQTLASSIANAGDSYDAVALAPDGSRIYALGAEVETDGSLPSLTVTASDPLSGTELWSTVVPELGTDGAQLIVNTQGSTLFVGGGGLLHGAGALDANTGALLWSRTWTGPSGIGELSRSIALAPDGSRLFAVGQTFVEDPQTFAMSTEAIAFGLDASTGVELWVDSFSSAPKGDATGNDIVVSADSTRVYSTGQTDVVGGGKDLFVRAFDAATGAVVWTTLFDLGSSLGGISGSDRGMSLAVDAVNARVFVSGTGAAMAPGSVLEPLSLALDAASGNSIWTSPATTAELTGLKAYSTAAELSPDGSRLFVVSFADQLPLLTRTVQVHALATNSGATTWQSSTAFPANTLGTASDIAVSPSGQRVFALLNLSEALTPQTVVSNQRTFAYSAATGVELWSAHRLGDTGNLSKGGGLAAGDGYVMVAGTTDLAGNGNDGFLTRLSSKPLVSGPPELSLAAGGIQQLQLDATSSAAGNAYWLLGSLAGTTPGLTLQGALLPLNVDGYFTLMLNSPNSAVHTGSLGLLDASGQASTTFNFPAGLSTSLAGLTLHHAFLAFDLLGTVTFTSNASALKLVP